MADDWVKARLELPSDPKTLRMARALKLDRWSVTGRLVDIWGWVHQHTVDGIGVELDDSLIDQRVDCAGFAQAMRSVKWLDGEDGALLFPFWERHNSDCAKARTLEAEAKRLRRANCKANNPTTRLSDKESDNCPTAAAGNVRPEKNREEKRNRETHTQGPVGGAIEAGNIPTLTDVEAEGEAGNLDLQVCRIWFHEQDGRRWIDPKTGGALRDWRGFLRAYCNKWRKNERRGSAKPSTRPSQGKAPAVTFRSSCESPADTRPEEERHREGAIFRLRENLASEAPLEGRYLAVARGDWKLLGGEIPEDLIEMPKIHPEIVDVDGIKDVRRNAA